MIYYIYHIPGKKVGVTTNLKRRVEDQQGYGPGEYEVLAMRHDITEAAKYEAMYQRLHGYPVDIVPYDKLNCNKNKLNKMEVNVTEQTTTFPCPADKLKGRLMDSIGMRWMTEHGEFIITPATIKWIMSNVKTSMFNAERSYVYNKAFARYYDNNDAYAKFNGQDQYNGKTLAGGLSPERVPECCDKNNPCSCKSEPQFSKRPKQKTQFDLIRDWADERGLYDSGDSKTQALKLVEEVGEICRAVLKNDRHEIIDGIGDCVVVLTNLAELIDMPIEDCIEVAYAEISNRTGKMVNGTFVKD
jgi:NTP pyrophosphatase (non-canonical NTP hydrolase)